MNPSSMPSPWSPDVTGQTYTRGQEGCGKDQRQETKKQRNQAPESTRKPAKLLRPIENPTGTDVIRNKGERNYKQGQ